MSRRPGAPTAPASTWSSCTRRTAICSRASSRRSPTSARDEYGGSLENRLRFPLEVFRAMRAAWPDEKPMSVRISATDWADGGLTGDDAVEVARAFAEAGCDLIDVSTGQTVADAAAGLRPHVPDAVLRPDPQRGRARHHVRRRDHDRRPGQHHHRRRPRRSGRAGAPAPRRSVFHPARRRPGTARPRSIARRNISPARTRSSATASASARSCATCGSRPSPRATATPGRRRRSRASGAGELRGIVRASIGLMLTCIAARRVGKGAQRGCKRVGKIVRAP